MPPFRPMLASNELVTKDNLHLLQFPLWGTPKKDGIRAQVFYKNKEHVLYSRKHIPIPNVWLQDWCNEQQIPPFSDGELVVLQANGFDADFQTCQSRILSAFTVPFKWKFYIFDRIWTGDNDPGYLKRFREIAIDIANTPHLANVELLRPKKLRTVDEVLEYEHEQVDINGEEGVILRSNGHYKQDRCTFNEQLMLKLKRKEQREARIIGFVERKRNINTAIRDNVGKLKRSKTKAGSVGMNMLGAFWVRDLKDGTEFKLSGFTDDFARWAWEYRYRLTDEIVSYEKLIHGEKNKPRSPIFKGIRNKLDLDV